MDFPITIEAELIGHNKNNVWFRVPTRRHNGGGRVVDLMGSTAFRGLTYPTDTVDFRPGTHPKGSMFTITTDNAEVYHNGHGYRLVGGIGSITLIEREEVEDADDDDA